MARRGRASLPTLASLPASRDVLAAMVKVYAGEAKSRAERARLDLLSAMLRRDADHLGDRICRVCGCSDFDPCADGHGATCWWLEADLCSCCGDGGTGAGVRRDFAEDADGGGEAGGGRDGREP